LLHDPRPPDSLSQYKDKGTLGTLAELDRGTNAAQVMRRRLNRNNDQIGNLDTGGRHIRDAVYKAATRQEQKAKATVLIIAWRAAIEETSIDARL
jgi:hypothetical protein